MGIVHLTMHDRTLLDRITKYSGDEPGTGALMTWVDSGWPCSCWPRSRWAPRVLPYAAWGRTCLTSTLTGFLGALAIRRWPAQQGTG